MLKRASQRWNPELRSRSLNRITGVYSTQFDFNMLNAESREERINLALRLCKPLLGSTVLSGHDFFSRVCSRRERERKKERERAERERERERERVDRTYCWRKFRFQWLSQRSEEGQGRLEVQVRGTWSGKAYRSMPTSLQRTDRVFRLGLKRSSFFAYSLTVNTNDQFFSLMIIGYCDQGHWASDICKQ